MDIKERRELVLTSRPYSARLYSYDRSDFRTVTNSRVLIYWPHGLGDWVMLSYLLPLLEPSNTYAVTRFGDGYVSLMEGNRYAKPVYLGVNAVNCNDGADYGMHHFNVIDQAFDGSYVDFSFPTSLYDYCCRQDIDTVLWSGFPEIVGSRPFPYHSKPRYLLPYLVPKDILTNTNIEAPLESAINFNVGPELSAWIEARLRSHCLFGERKLCIISRTGFTAHRKNWGHLWRETEDGGRLREGEECRDFMRLLLKKDPNWMFLSIENERFDGEHTLRSRPLNAFTYAELFGTEGEFTLPFGLVMKILLNLADLFVGIPSGPLCLSMVKPELPTIGLWLQHLPSWYLEPKQASIQIVSRNLYDSNALEKPGSFSEAGGLTFNTMSVDTHRITGEQVMDAAEALL